MIETASKIGRRTLDMPLEAQPVVNENGQLDEIARALGKIE